jgi:hypothetical protein
MESLIQYYNSHRYHQPWIFDIGSPLQLVITSLGSSYQAELQNHERVLFTIVMEAIITIINDDDTITIAHSNDNSRSIVTSSRVGIMKDGNTNHGDALMGNGELIIGPLTIDLFHFQITIDGLTDRIVLTPDLISDTSTDYQYTLINNPSYWSFRVTMTPQGVRFPESMTPQGVRFPESMELSDDIIYYYRGEYRVEYNTTSKNLRGYHHSTLIVTVDFTTGRVTHPRNHTTSYLPGYDTIASHYDNITYMIDQTIHEWKSM